MTYSMTGFGKANFQLKNKSFVVEIKTLNSKQTDMYFRLPAVLQEIEIDSRNIVAEELLRGKINVNIHTVDNTEVESYKIDTNVLDSYYKQVKEISTNKEQLLNALLGLPNVVVSSQDELNDAEKQTILQAIKTTCAEVMQYRQTEGKVLQEDVEKRIEIINQSKQNIEKLAPQRIEKIKTRIKDNLGTLKGDVSYNEDKFEQELIYYIEKLDITEEFVRLNAHTSYFLEELLSKEPAKGKKLNFIAQEIGREINTIGSKANDAEIQKEVVQMKDELEKIKEQINNIL